MIYNLLLNVPQKQYSKFILFTILVISMSCTNTRKATYFNDINDTKYTSSSMSLEPILQKNDILSISVSSLNPEANELFNSLNLSATQTSSSTGITSNASGYLIDQDGLIHFPFLGRLQAAGKTKKALKDEITQELIDRKLLLEPIVNIRYLNYKVSVLGEVAKPSVLTIPNEKVTLMEAIGLAGDLTIYAKRNNILLIREKEGTKQITRIDLTSDEIFTSPYYYLESNDIIYVEPNTSKVASTSRTTQWLPIIISTLSLAVIALDRFLK